MPQSLTKIYLHLIFSTKHRAPMIDDGIKDELYAYLGGVCRATDCEPVKIGGYYDHVHILCRFSKKIALMDLLEEVKKRSSKWIKTKGAGYANFYWQDGYAAFSVNPSQLQVVTDYIANQYQRHSKQGFQDECRAFFKKYGVEYDERYVRD